jgi:polyhydroxybutyrate depolymerase
MNIHCRLFACLLASFVSLTVWAGESGRTNAPATRVGSWQSGRHTLSVDGLQRTFLLDVPPDLKPGAALVMVFHGFTDSAKSVRQYSGFSALASRRGFVAVYPQGTRDADGNTFFNVGYEFHQNLKVDDVKFARELAARLVRDLDLDPQSVFATGMSNGGDMCNRLVCQPQPFVRAVAPVAGTIMSAWTNGFTPRVHVPVLAVHGTSDTVTLWKGDLADKDGWGAYLGAEAVMDYWVKIFSLEQSQATDIDMVQLKNNCPIRLHRWWTAADDTEVRFYEIQGGGHDWPDNLGNPDRSTAEEIWNFFAAHRRKEPSRFSP